MDNTIEDRRNAAKFRDELGVTQADVAHMAKVSQAKLSLWENQFVDFTPAELKRVGEVFDKLWKKHGAPGFKAMLAGTWAEQRAKWNKKQITRGRKSLRKQARLSQMALAEKIGITVKRYQAFEANRIDLTDGEHAKWADTISSILTQRLAANPWMRPAFMADNLLKERAELLAERKGFLSRLQSLVSIDDPVIAEIMESFRREIAQLEEQVKQPAESDAKGD